MSWDNPGSFRQPISDEILRGAESMAAAFIFLLVLIALGLMGFNVTRRAFRRMLPEELDNWLAEGIISESQAATLRERYQLNRLGQESQIVITRTIFGFGAVLIALGIIAFVAANWEVIPKYGKLGLLLTAMIAAHGIGFWLWRGRKNSPHLGHALVMLGTLIFGAAIALIAQLFQIHTGFYNGFLIWAIGAAAMGYALGSAPHLLLAIIASFIWYIGWLGDFPTGFPVYLLFSPVLFLPFTYFHHSRSVHFLTLLGWGAAVVGYVTPLEPDKTAVFLIADAVTLGWMFWSYGDWADPGRKLDFDSDGKILGVLILAITGYILSFHAIAGAVGGCVWKLEGGYRLGISVGLWISAFISIGAGLRKRKGELETVRTYPVGLLIGSGLVGITFMTALQAEFIGTILANLAVISLGGLLFWRGLNALDRRYFWLGLLLLAAEVIGRFFEYETGLLWKSFAFIITGLGLMYGGWLFEQRRGRWDKTDEI